jgi:hypothetical protein
MSPQLESYVQSCSFLQTPVFVIHFLSVELADDLERLMTGAFWEAAVWLARGLCTIAVAVLWAYFMNPIVVWYSGR